MNTTKRARWSAAIALTVLLGAAACSSDSKTATADSSATSSGASSTLSSSSGSSSAGADVDVTNPLGPEQKATGSPVKVGMIADGASQGISNDIDGQAATATVKWLNEHRGGLAGHTIELDLCITNADPSKAGDCANQLVADGVVAVVIANSTQSESFWSVLHAANIPVMFYGVTAPELLADPNTFSLTNPVGLLVNFPAALAKSKSAKKVTAVVIDVPAAVSAFGNDVPRRYSGQGLELDVVAVPPGTADMTAQMQQVVSNNPDGVVTVVGNDSFCIAAFNGLRTAGFKGTVASIAECISDSTKTSVPGDFLKGIAVGATTPLKDPTNPSTIQYLAVLEKYGEAGIDREANNGIVSFITVASFATAVRDLKGDLTSASVAAAIKAMADSVMPGTGGQHFKCDGKQDPTGVAICATGGVLTTTLDTSGNVTTFTKLG